MQANEAIEKLRAALSAMLSDSAPGAGMRYAAACDTLAATATIDPPGEAVGVETAQQGNAIRPSAEPAGQHSATRPAFEKWFYDFRDFVTPTMFRRLIDDRRYESMETECAWQGYLAGLAAAEQSAPPVPRMDGNTSEESDGAMYARMSAAAAPDDLKAAAEHALEIAAQPAADHAKLIADALELAHDLALDQQAEIAARYEGYKPGKHVAAARDVELAKEALAVWQARGQQAGVAEDATDAARFRYIEDNGTTHGGGNGFTITCFVPVDHEDMGCGIDAAIARAAILGEAK